MTPTTDQKDHVIALLAEGEKQQATKFVQENFGLNAAQAQAFVDELEKQNSQPTVNGQQAVPTAGTLRMGRSFIVVFAFFSVLTLGPGIWLGIRSYNFLQTAQRVPGIIVDIESYESDNDDGGSTTMYRPVFQYTWNNEAIRVRHNVSTNWSPTLGEPVTLLINPADPEHPREDSFVDNWLLPVVLLGFGAIFVFVAVRSRNKIKSLAESQQVRYNK